MGMMTEILKERRVLSNLRLTVHQKAVLTRALNAPTPRIATDNTTRNSSMVGARDQLAKLGLITFDGANTSITPEGEALMKDENLIDDGGQLTQDGNEFAFDDEDQPGGEVGPGEEAAGGADGPGDQSAEMPAAPAGQEQEQ